MCVCGVNAVHLSIGVSRDDYIRSKKKICQQSLRGLPSVYLLQFKDLHITQISFETKHRITSAYHPQVTIVYMPCRTAIFSFEHLYRPTD